MLDKCKAMTLIAHATKQVRCSRRATKDGYCNQHHPDTIAKRRARAVEKSDAAYQSRKKQWAKMRGAQNKLDAIANIIKNNHLEDDGYVIQKIYQIASDKK